MEEYREEVDSAYAFYNEKMFRMKDTRIAQKSVYNSYLEWCNDNHITPMSSRQFGRQLGSYGVKSKVSNSIRYYLDIQVDDLEPVPQQKNEKDIF